MATFDRRRIPAPETSRPRAVSLAGPSRTRAHDEPRPLFIKTGLVTQANGSAYVEADGVKIACSAFGPRQRPPPFTSSGTLNVEVKFAPFASCVRRAPLRDTEPISHAAVLTTLLQPAVHLHLLPKLAVDVHVYVLEGDSDAGVLAAGLSAACAALADAGIPLAALAVGSSVALPSPSSPGPSLSPSSALLDPSGPECSAASAVLTLGAMPALGRATGLHMTGEADVDAVCGMVEVALGGAGAAHTAVAQALLEAA
ncbi:hypothetical protein CspeluHIS016_0206290 [Cutaneotrichosporon spelunceum]|uniref:Exoribonuclease phosphorolytic domain-containing protein n=1 Tax=Cutaneotrichosporon spelunceum TaxID=1672016 RepID=A0AAD3TRE9_9TREE|nr:hypothetical protein CspeluHIS016_0206290 [Cutaneotrichosporon spelunceum]